MSWLLAKLICRQRRQNLFTVPSESGGPRVQLPLLPPVSLSVSLSLPLFLFSLSLSLSRSRSFADFIRSRKMSNWKLCCSHSCNSQLDLLQLQLQLLLQLHLQHQLQLELEQGQICRSHSAYAFNWRCVRAYLNRANNTLILKEVTFSGSFMAIMIFRMGQWCHLLCSDYRDRGMLPPSTSPPFPPTTPSASGWAELPSQVSRLKDQMQRAMTITSWAQQQQQLWCATIFNIYVFYIYYYNDHA